MTIQKNTQYSFKDNIKYVRRYLLIILSSVFFLSGCEKIVDDPYLEHDLYESLINSRSFISENFYFSTPHWDLEPDYDHCDENHACRSTKYTSMEDYKRHIMNDYDLTEDFADTLINRYPDCFYELEDGLYVVDADSGSNISVGNLREIKCIRKAEDKILLRITYERIDVHTGKISGTFNVDNVAVLVDDRWLWDDIPMIH